MPLLHEWIAGKTDAGEELPADRVRAYRLKTGQNASAWQDCRHRGPVLHERKADLCGRRGQTFPVFRCELHGECTLTRFCEKQPGRLCYLCEDAEAAGV